MKRWFSYAREGTVIVLMAVLLSFELEAVLQRRFIKPYWEFRLWTLGLHTPWTMFNGAHPNRGWMMVVLHFKKGGPIDALTGKHPVWTRPKNILSLYPNTRWSKYYFTTSTILLQKKLHDGIGRYYGLEWNRKHPENPAHQVQVIQMVQPMFPMYNNVRPRITVTGWVKLVQDD